MAPLLSLAVNAGLPMLTGILKRRIGRDNAELATTVAKHVAKRAGVEIDALPALAENEPERVTEAMAYVEEHEAAELIELRHEELQGKLAILAAERQDPVWARAWKQLAMYGFGVLWFWALIVQPSLNQFAGSDYPPVDLATLFQLNGLYMMLYMGGHTVKDFVGKRFGGGS